MERPATGSSPCLARSASYRVSTMGGVSGTSSTAAIDERWPPRVCGVLRITRAPAGSVRVAGKKSAELRRSIPPTLGLRRGRGGADARPDPEGRSVVREVCCQRKGSELDGEGRGRRRRQGSTVESQGVPSRAGAREPEPQPSTLLRALISTQPRPHVREHRVPPRAPPRVSVRRTSSDRASSQARLRDVRRLVFTGGWR